MNNRQPGDFSLFTVMVKMALVQGETDTGPPLAFIRHCRHEAGFDAEPDEVARCSRKSYICCRSENMKTLISHLLGDTRTAILATLLLRPDEPQHLRALARLTGVSPGTLHRELTALTALGVLRRDQIGRQVFFSADPECPVFEELAGLLRKTAGLLNVIGDALRPCSAHIRGAFIYGSTAAGTEGAYSDVDVMILGDLPFAEAVRVLAPTEAVLRREVNPTVMKVDDFVRKRESNDGFVSAVWGAPKLWVMGGEHELG